MNFSQTPDTTIQSHLSESMRLMLLSDAEIRCNACNVLFNSLPQDVRQVLSGAALMLLAVERDRVKTLVLMVIYREQAVLSHAPQYQRLHILREAVRSLFNVGEVSIYGSDNALQTGFRGGVWKEWPLPLPTDWQQQRGYQ